MAEAFPGKQFRCWISPCIRSRHSPNLVYITYTGVWLVSGNRIRLKLNILGEREGNKSQRNADVTPSYFSLMPVAQFWEAGTSSGIPPSLLWMSCDTVQTRHHDDVIKRETFSALLALCAGNSPVPVNSPHKGQWRGALMFSLICARINDWVNNREAGDLRRHRCHYDVNVMISYIGTFMVVATNRTLHEQ